MAFFDASLTEWKAYYKIQAPELELQMGARHSSDSRINQPANQNELADLLGLRNDSPRITNQFPASVPAPQVSGAPIIAASFPALFYFVNRSSDNAQNNNQRAASSAMRNATGLIGRNAPRIE
ncbi:hypothetical protein ACOME3_000224 [Neoechinorhynchus agilis]